MSQASFKHDLKARTILVRKTFDASITRVWRAWTDSTILDKWWGPQPWNAVTKSFDFKPGGLWHYYMSGPEGEKHWCRVDYLTITPEKSFTARDTFCDEAGAPNENLPSNNWHVEFKDHGSKTEVVVTITFETEDDLKTIIDMGFEQGFSIGLKQLEALLARN